MTTDEIMALADEWYAHGQMSHSGIDKKYAALRAAVDQIVRENFTLAAGQCIVELLERAERAERELEQERVRLAGCGVAAMSNTPESLARAREIKQSSYGHSASYDACCDAVEREITLRRERDELRALLKEAYPLLYDARPELLARIDAALRESK